MFSKSEPDPDVIDVSLGPATFSGNLRCDGSIRIERDGGQDAGNSRPRR